MGLLNYSTSISADKTAGEIQSILAKHGAGAIMIEYKEGTAEALSFKVKTPQSDCGFRLPVDPLPVLKVLEKQRGAGKLRSHGVPVNQEQAVKVAWRIVKDWVEAQMALLETEMVRIEEVFLPYLITDSGETLYQVMAGKGFLLGPGEKGKV